MSWAYRVEYVAVMSTELDFMGSDCLDSQHTTESFLRGGCPQQVATSTSMHLCWCAQCASCLLCGILNAGANGVTARTDGNAVACATPPWCDMSSKNVAD